MSDDRSHNPSPPTHPPHPPADAEASIDRDDASSTEQPPPHPPLPPIPPSPTLDPESLDLTLEADLPPPAVVDRQIARAAPRLTPDGRLMSGKLAGLSMAGAILTLSWPILIESVLNSTVGLTDTLLSAQLSEAATDAIGGASYMLWFVGLVAMSVGIGTTALVARAIGGGRFSVANAAVGQSILLAAVSGVLVAALLWAVSPLAATILSLKGDARNHFIEYLRVISFGVPGITLISAGIAAARGAGDSLRPLWAMVLMNVLNVAGSFVLSGVDLVRPASLSDPAGAATRILIKNPGLFDLGVPGIAWGTVIGAYAGAAFMLGLLLSGTSGVTILRRRLKPHRVTLDRLIRLAVPSFLETFGMWIGNFMVVLMVGWIGLERLAQAAAASAVNAAEGGVGGMGGAGGAMGAHIIAIRLESFSYLPGFALGTAAATLVGQFLGAGSPVQAHRAVQRCLVVSCAIMAAAGLVFILLPRQIVSLVSTQPSHLELAPALMFITGWVQIPFGISIVLRSALRGAGDAKAVAALMWITTYGVRLPLAYLFSGVTIPTPFLVPLGGPESIPHPFFESADLARLWVALCFEIVIRAALYYARFHGGKWQTARV